MCKDFESLKDLQFCEYCNIYFELGGFNDEHKGHPSCPLCAEKQIVSHLESILTPEQRKELPWEEKENHDDAFGSY